MAVELQLEEVEVEALDAARFEPLVGTERIAHFERVAEETRERLAGRAVVNVNSTAVGGGVAEMLQTLLAYARGAGVDARWLVIKGDPTFFAVTKRIHNGLYGGPGTAGRSGRTSGRTTRRSSARTPRRSSTLLRARRRRPAARSADGRDGAGASPRGRGSSSGAATSGSTSRTSGASARGRSCAPTSRTSTPTSSRARPSRPRGPTRRRRSSFRRRSTRSRPRTSRCRTGTSASRSATPVSSRATGDPPVVPFTRRDGSRGRITRRVGRDSARAGAAGGRAARPAGVALGRA